MKIAQLTAILALPALALTACGPNGLTKQDAGLGIGAVAGGIIGNQVGNGTGKVLATAAGAVIGGIVGSEIGRALDEQDRRYAQEAEFEALERGQSGGSTPWRNPDSGHYGMVVPSQAYEREGSNCRDYTHTVYINGEPETMRGTACRNPDGTWQNVG